ncbi:MAG TPA: PfkB family carbohydrate kinase [Gemmatimonadales bacterium]|nr:PfkB family carbohydrate kinase [Gemmatimonadales bacterium]
MKPEPATDHSPISDPGLNGALDRRFSLTLIGDVRLELRAQLPGRSFADLKSSYFDYASMQAMVSGSATNMAQHAVRYFQRVDVIAKVGDDAFGPIIRQHFREYGIGDHLLVEPRTSNGLTVMLHDTAGVRVLLASDRPPSSTLSAQDIRQKSRVLTKADRAWSGSIGTPNSCAGI